MEFGELFLFGAKFGGVGDQGAARAPGGMLDVQHLVVEDVLHGRFGNVGTVHAAIQQDVARAGIVAAELAAPVFCAPADVGTCQFSFEVFLVQFIEKFF